MLARVVLCSLCLISLQSVQGRHRITEIAVNGIVDPQTADRIRHQPSHKRLQREGKRYLQHDIAAIQPESQVTWPQEIKLQPVDTVQEKFNSIYANKVWGQYGRGSGLGSTPAATTVTRAILRTVVAKYRLHSILDAPCGAVEWQPAAVEQIVEDDPTFTYLDLDIERDHEGKGPYLVNLTECVIAGMDVVGSVIEGNRQRLAGVPYMRFEEGNLANKTVPRGYDLILSRDALQHLPCKLGVDMLENLAKGQARYLLLGSYDGVGNTNIRIGDYFGINLREHPYNLDEGVLHVYREHTPQDPLHLNEPEKLLLLFSGKYLMDVDFNQMRQNCPLPRPQPLL